MEQQNKRIPLEIRKHRIEQLLEHWEARYNGDNDLIPGAPVVTASDMAALDMIRDLLCLIEEMQDQIDTFQGTIMRHDDDIENLANDLAEHLAD